MSFSLKLTWTGQQENHNPKDHLIEFGSDQSLDGSAVTDYLGVSDKVNPEESLLAALSCCHMLSFLTIAQKMRLNVVSYVDHCEAKLGINSQGRTAITQIKLAPKIGFASSDNVSRDQLTKIYSLAHKNCFIANSLSAEIKLFVDEQ